MSKLIRVKDTDNVEDIKKKIPNFNEKLTNTTEQTTYNEENPYEFEEQLINAVESFTEIDDKIRKLQNDIKELKKLRAKNHDEILVHLERLGEKQINIDGGKLIVNQYKSKGFAKEKALLETLDEEIKDVNIKKNIVDKIETKKKKSAKTRIQLKRTFENEKKKNKK